MRREHLTGTVLIAALGLAGAAHAEGNKSAQHGQSQQQEQHDQQRSDTAHSGSEEAGSEEASTAAPQRQRSAQWGLSDQQVRDLQRNLSEQGFYQGNVDGIIGPQTQAALRQFQEQQGIEASGRWNQATAEALGMHDVTQSERQPVRGTEPAGIKADQQVQRRPGMEQDGVQQDARKFQLSALSNEQVRDLQRDLQQQGHYRGEIDGVVGPQTRAALRSFFQEQVRLADQGALSDAGIAVFNMTPEEIQPVSGQEREPEGSARDDY